MKDDYSIQIQPELEKIVYFTGENGKIVGKLYLEKELRFEGEAEESAKVFIKWLKELWNS